MTDAAHVSEKHAPAGQGTATPSAAVFVVSFLGAIAAAGAAFGLGGTLGVGVGAVIGLVAAGVCAALAAQGARAPAVKVAALLDIALSDQAPNDPPPSFRSEPWLSLYREVASSGAAQRASAMALLELEKMRREHDGAPMESEVHEPRPTHAASELIGSDVDAPTVEESGRDVGRRTVDALRSYEAGVVSIETDLGDVLHALTSGTVPASNGGNGSPAAMVDALVRTAADGIEDLAAGLMRANELAGVAEKVTNRATLLALNAALEATRSGSEAFASIAEETRRLAEFAREATDTISRLSSEIEFKVGDTIASIQSSSEDAKAAVASIGSESNAGAVAVAPATLAAVESLVARTRALRERLDASIGEFEGDADAPSMGPSPVAIDEAEPVDMGPAYDDADRFAPVAEPPADDDPDSVGLDPSVEATVSEVPTVDAAPSDDPFEPVAPSNAADHVEPRAIDPEPVRDAESEGGDEAPSATEAEDGAAPAPPIEANIPDWLEGIQPGGPR